VNAGDIASAVILLEIFGDIVQNLVAGTNTRPEFVH
jgi:hypothetical protein